MTSAGTKTVTVTYQGKAATFDITVTTADGSFTATCTVVVDPATTTDFGVGAVITGVFPVTNLSELNAAINAANTTPGNYIININADFTYTDWVGITNEGGVTVSLRGGGHTLSAGTGGWIGVGVFGSGSNPETLILRDITLQGDATANPDSGGVTVNTSGTLIMESGAVITGFKRFYGGGVQVYGGSFYMKGGEIRGNAADSPYISGGGVCVLDGNAHFEKTGGIIYGAEADGGNANTTAGSHGAAVSVYDNNTSAKKQVLYRDTTAGTGDDLSVTLSSGALGTHSGGWTPAP
jgi:hypothetical protein